jgi:hypothetical protein
MPAVNTAKKQQQPEKGGLPCLPGVDELFR